MQSFWEIVASNALLVVVLAAGVALLGRIWKNPLCLHLLWLLVLLKLVTPPLVTVPLPLPARQIPAPSQAPVAEHFAAEPSPVEVSRRETASPTALNEERGRFVENRPAQENEKLAADAGVTCSVAPRAAMSWPAVLGWTWGVGIALFACGYAWRILRFKRLLRSSEASSSALSDMAAGIAKRLGLRRVPEIRVLPVCVSPLAWSLGGTARVYLPTGLFERLDGAAREAILAHELAHVRRGDHWVRLLEVVVTTLFWWHPVVWLAVRRLRELEDQCCDGMVVDLSPHGVKSYATALLDTLDFLSERSIAAPLLATAANSSNSLARRIAMMKNHPINVRLTAGRLVLLAAVAVVPMALAFAAKPPEPENGGQTPPKDRRASEQPAVERRAVNKAVKDFPEKTDLSTPESAQAAWNRASGRMDDKAVLELSWIKWGPREIERMKQDRKRDPKDTETYADAQLNAEILEVATYRRDFADVISKLKFPPGVGRDPYSSRSFGRINGAWKNLGEDRLPSLEAARENFDRKKDNLWRNYVEVRDKVLKGETVSVGENERVTRFPPMAPGSPLGISVEKADLMGRIEWAMMHGARDITSRKSLEWGEVEKDKDGNRTIRYMFEATIWGKDVMIINKVFTFDAKGNMLKMEDVEGYPKKKVEKPADVSTQKGMKELVEDFFNNNFRDITSRETIEWGDVVKAENGNSSIRYKYRAKIWEKETKIMNQVFTFDAKGKFVSVKNVEGFPKDL